MFYGRAELKQSDHRPVVGIVDVQVIIMIMIIIVIMMIMMITMITMIRREVLTRGGVTTAWPASVMSWGPVTAQ